MLNKCAALLVSSSETWGLHLNDGHALCESGTGTDVVVYRCGVGKLSESSSGVSVQIGSTRFGEGDPEENDVGVWNIAGGDSSIFMTVLKSISSQDRCSISGKKGKVSSSERCNSSKAGVFPASFFPEDLKSMHMNGGVEAFVWSLVTLRRTRRRSHGRFFATQRPHGSLVSHLVLL